jgi:hypothetical protein
MEQTMDKNSLAMYLEIMPYMIAAIAGLLGILIGIVGWHGSRLFDQLDTIADTLKSMERDLRNELAKLDRRVSVVEATQEMQDTGSNSRRRRG